MPHSTDNLGSAAGGQGSKGASREEASSHLLRFSHIFGSVVRELLVEKPLAKVSPCPLTVSQFHLLKLMSCDGQHQLGRVADFLGVSPPAATKNIDKLERLGLVIRSPSKGDRRATLLSVSSKGRRLVRKYEELRTARLSSVLDRFRPEEIEQLGDLLERFAVTLLNLEQSVDKYCLRCSAYIEDGCPVGQIRGGCPYQKVRGPDPKAGAAGEV